MPGSEAKPESPTEKKETEETTTTEASDSSKKTWQTWSVTVQAIVGVLLFQLFFKALTEAYTIRLHAINEYGRIIHEFDPYVSSTSNGKNGHFAVSFANTALYLSSITVLQSICTNMDGKPFVSGLTTWCGILWAARLALRFIPACKLLRWQSRITFYQTCH